jgi:hypothetical protein
VAHHGGTLIAVGIVLALSIFADFSTIPLWAALLVCSKLDFVIDEIRKQK